MNIFEETIEYKGFTIYCKYDIWKWRAYTQKSVTINNKSENFKFDEMGDSGLEAIQKVKVKIDQLNHITLKGDER